MFFLLVRPFCGGLIVPLVAQRLIVLWLPGNCNFFFFACMAGIIYYAASGGRWPLAL